MAWSIASLSSGKPVLPRSRPFLRIASAAQKKQYASPCCSPNVLLNELDDRTTNFYRYIGNNAYWDSYAVSPLFSECCRVQVRFIYRLRLFVTSLAHCPRGKRLLLSSLICLFLSSMVTVLTVHKKRVRSTCVKISPPQVHGKTCLIGHGGDRKGEIGLTPGLPVRYIDQQYGWYGVWWEQANRLYRGSRWKSAFYCTFYTIFSIPASKCITHSPVNLSLPSDLHPRFWGEILGSSVRSFWQCSLSWQVFIMAH